MDWKEFGNSLRKHLLTGVSYMIPFVVPGGILIALGFLVGGIHWDNPASQFIATLGQTAFGLMMPALAGYIAYSIADRPGIAPGFVAGMIATNQGSGFIGALFGGLIAGYFVQWIKSLRVPRAVRSLMPVLLIPLFGTLGIGLVMTFLIGPPATWLNTSMTAMLNNMSTGSKVVLGIILGAMMAFDMGGPVGKVAYFFAVGLGGEGNWYPMAAAMVAGMSPPIGCGLAALLAPKKFTVSENKAATSCFVGGASFISEFAIPYAVADPLRVIPSLMIGSAVGAVMSMLFNISLTAPHGGLFVVMLANKPLLWLLCLAVGSLVTAGALIFIKPELSEEEASGAEASPGLSME